MKLLFILLPLLMCAAVIPSHRPVSVTPDSTSSSFLPTDIPNLRLWLRACDSSGNNVSVYNDSDVIASNGDSVKTWNDESGNGFHFAASGTKYAKYAAAIQNGKPSVTNGVVGGINTYILSTASISSSSDYSVFILIHPNNLNPTQYILDTETGRMVLASSVNSIQISMFDGSFHDVGAALSTTQLLEYMLKSGTTSANIYTNSVQCGSNFTYTQKAIGGHTALGSDFLDGGASFMHGYIMEVIIYASNLSATDRQKVENYLNSKWAIW